MRDELSYILTTHRSPLTTHRSLLIAHHSSLTSHHSPLTTHRSLLTAHHSQLKPKNMSQINSFRDLIVYQKAYKLAMEIFEITKAFPKEERYSLTDQIRRSSRSVTSNIGEAWAKKIYLKNFVSKLSDSHAEEYETEVWLDYSRACGYIDETKHEHFMEDYDEVRKMLISMMTNPEKFCRKKV